MVKKGKIELEKEGFSPDLIFQADLKDVILSNKFDVTLAFGVFPHIQNEREALLKIKKFLNKNAHVFIVFKNDLFATFTFNKYSFDFMLRLIDNKFPKKSQ